MASQTVNRARIEALRQKARLVIAVERELRDLQTLRTQEYASAEALVATIEARGQAKSCVLAEHPNVVNRRGVVFSKVRKHREFA